MKNRRRLIYTSILFVLVAAYALWAPKGISQLNVAPNNGCVVEISPKGTYRVEICRPALPYFSFSKEMPRFVRFYDQRSQEILGESDILEMSGRGEVFWPRRATYDYCGRW